MIRASRWAQMKRRLRLLYAAQEWWCWYGFYRSTGFRGVLESAQLAFGVTSVIMGWRPRHPEQSRGK
jgi:hypothetical protein